MKAAILTKLNAPLELWDVEPQRRPDDKVCGPNQVLVDIVATGICGAQLKEIDGSKGDSLLLPRMLGHEACGTVREVGAGVSVQLLGKRVVAHWRKGEGGEAHAPARYDTTDGGSVGGGHITTFSEQAILSRNRVTVVPDDVPPELCAMLGCGLSTALGTIEQEARLGYGESILIVGCGGLGINLIQAAKLRGAYPIVATDLVDEKRNIAHLMGASQFVDARDYQCALRTWGIKGFDVIVDTSGSVQALEATIPLLADGGRYIMVGQPKPKEDVRLIAAMDLFHSQHGVHIQTTQGGGFRPSEAIPRYVNLWRSGALNLDAVVSHRISLSEINAGLDLVRAGQAGRVLVYPK